MNAPQPIGQADPTSCPAAGQDSPPIPLPNEHPSPTSATAGGWVELRIWAENLHDVLEMRKATDNRLRRPMSDVDDTMHLRHGFEASLHGVELDVRRALRHAFRRAVAPEIQEWIKQTPGIREDAMGRLLGHLGHPVWAVPHHDTAEPQGEHVCAPSCREGRHLVEGEPFARTLAQLWQYCGHGGPSRKKQGQQVTWSPTCKTVLWQVSSAAFRWAGPYRTVYLDAKLHVQDRTHAAPCPPCSGLKGKPAEPGTPWRDGHKHAHGLRIVGKEILRDLWTVAGGPRSSGSHSPSAPGDGPQ